MLGRLYARFPGRYVRDNKGVAAVEFALIVPILMLLFVGTLEISMAVSVDRKISRVSSTVADLITQESIYTMADLNKITDVAQRIMYPYDDSDVKISIVGIDIENDVGRVAWSHGRNGGEEPAVGSVYTVPNAILTSDKSFLLSATISVDHKPAFSFIGFDGTNMTFDDAAISLSEQMFLRARVPNSSPDGSEIECSDCN